jgi:hypothetical protein
LFVANNNDRAKKIERVRKLLELARNHGANEHEAANALALAQAQMRTEGITDTEISASAAAEAFTQKGAMNRVPKWEDRLAGAIGRTFACDCIHHSGSGQWSFVGIDPLPDLASYAFDVLRRQCLEARRHYVADTLRRVASRASKVRRADLFTQGWVETAISKVQALYRPPAHTEAVLAYKAVTYPKLGSLTPFNRNEGRNLREHEVRDLLRGRSAGADADLRHGVGVQGRDQLKITRT